MFSGVACVGNGGGLASHSAVHSLGGLVLCGCQWRRCLCFIIGTLHYSAFIIITNNERQHTSSGLWLSRNCAIDSSPSSCTETMWSVSSSTVNTTITQSLLLMPLRLFSSRRQFINNSSHTTYSTSSYGGATSRTLQLQQHCASQTDPAYSLCRSPSPRSRTLACSHVAIYTPLL